MAAEPHKHRVDVVQEFIANRHAMGAIWNSRSSSAPRRLRLKTFQALLLAVFALALNDARAEEPAELKHLRETCPEGAFPTSLEAIVARPHVPMPSEAERRRDPGGMYPAEINALKFGLIHSVVGMSVNDGWSMWGAIDFDRRVVIDIQSKSGRQLQMNPNLLSDKEPPGALKRVNDRGSLGPVVEIVRTAPISDAELLNAACLANRLVALDRAARRLQIMPTLRMPIADIHESNIELVAGPRQEGYWLGDVNRGEYDQLLKLMRPK